MLIVSKHLSFIHSEGLIKQAIEAIFAALILFITKLPTHRVNNHFLVTVRPLRIVNIHTSMEYIIHLRLMERLA
jgi:hypothetical protein